MAQSSGPRTPIQPPPGRQGPIRVVEDHTAELKHAIEALGRVEVLIGIPSDADQPHHNAGGTLEPEQRSRSPEGIQSNATLGYIHEHGSPINNIPARPWLGPGVEESRHDWLRYMEQAGRAALTLPGNVQLMERALHAAGQTAVSAVKNRIVAGIAPPLSQRTIDARRARTPSRTAMTQDDVTPLVDTAQMLNSISYVIKR